MPPEMSTFGTVYPSISTRPFGKNISHLWNPPPSLSVVAIIKDSRYICIHHRAMKMSMLDFQDFKFGNPRSTTVLSKFLHHQYPVGFVTIISNVFLQIQSDLLIEILPSKFLYNVFTNPYTESICPPVLPPLGCSR